MMLESLLGLIDTLVALYTWTLLALVAASWLVAFNVINPWHPLMRQIMQALNALHEPILAPIRRGIARLIPNLGGLDLSPVVALLVVQFLVGPILKQVVLAFA